MQSCPSLPAIATRPTRVEARLQFCPSLPAIASRPTRVGGQKSASSRRLATLSSMNRTVTLNRRTAKIATDPTRPRRARPHGRSPPGAGQRQLPRAHSRARLAPSFLILATHNATQIDWPIGNKPVASPYRSSYK
jgi:hypothetical protein